MAVQRLLLLALASHAAAALSPESWRLSLQDPTAPRLVESLRPDRVRAQRLVHAPGKAATRATASSNSSDPYRLPTSIVPTFYKIMLYPKLHGDFKFQGDVLIDINVIEDTDKVVLNAVELEIGNDSVTLVDVSNSTAYTSQNITEDDEHEMITIDFGVTLTANKSYQLNFTKYIGYHNSRMEGFYRSSYMLGDEVRWLVTTQFEETGARLAFPCFDEPALKARFNISIARDSNYTAVSNMPLYTTVNDTSGNYSVVDTFEVSPPMSTYLVAFVVSDFKNLNDSTIFKTWGREEILKGGMFAQFVGPRALALEAVWTGIPFALPKEDQFAIPDFSAGAMENWGLVTYREPYLLHTNETTSRIKEYTACTICHELGHQWTGDLVTLDWWSHTWLNEGFATYFENYICAKIFPDWNLIDKYVPENNQVGMTADAEEDQIAMSSPVSTPDEMDAKFDDISYEKAGAVLRMFHNVLTPDVFRAGIHRYLMINAYKNTNPKKLYQALHEVAVNASVSLPDGTSFVEVGLTWSEQAGVPVVFAQRDYTTGELVLSQQRFFYEKPSTVHNESWYIPINWVTESNPDWNTTTASEWLTPYLSDVVVETSAASDEWLLVNPLANSYYRVAYDTANWKMLASALSANVSTIPTASRSQLLNDALNLARAGMLDYSTAMDVTKFLAQDTEVTTWMTAVNTLSFVRLRFVTTSGCPLLLQYISQLTTKAFQKVGMVVSDSDSHEDLMLRYYVTSWACYSGLEDCVSNATVLLKQWLADNNTVLHPDIRTHALCYGVRGGGLETFNGVKARWLNETYAAARTKLLAALACSFNETILNDFMLDALNGNLNLTNQTEVQDIFKAVFNKYENHDILLQFVVTYISEIDTFFNSSEFSLQLLVNLVSDTRAPSDYKSTMEYLEENLQSWSGYSNLTETLAATELDFTWYNNYYSTVLAWLTSELGLETTTTSSRTSRTTSRTTSRGGSTTTAATTSAETTTTTSSGSVVPAFSIIVGLISLIACTMYSNQQ